MLGYALKKSLGDGYSLAVFSKDLVAGLIVSLVALPLAMALAIAVGLPPQYGIYTAIVAGIIVPLLGGSQYQVSGPTAAFVVVIAPIVTQHGLRGLIITTIIAGAILIGLGLARLGRYINYIPYPVTTGFTSGMAVVIGVLALNDFWGLHIEKLQGSFLHQVITIFEHSSSLYWPEAALGLISLFLMVTSEYYIKKVPSPVVGIGIATIIACFLQHYGFEIATIGNRFSYILSSGKLAQGIPPYLPSFNIPGLSNSTLFSLPSLDELKTLFIPAIVVAALGALESLLSAAVADGMARTKHHPNAELIASGIGNILSGCAAGMPATGAIARTATNIQSGGRTPLSSALHGIFIILYVLFFSQYISYIPMAALASLLLITAYRMSQWRQFLRTIKIGSLDDAIVLVTCFGFTIFIDMVAGITVGVVLACFLLIKRIATITQLHVSHINSGYHHKVKNYLIPPNTIIYHIDGSLFFGNVEQLVEQIEMVAPQIHTFIIDLEDVPFVDMSGLIAIKRMITDLDKNKKQIILCAKKKTSSRIYKKLNLYLKNSIKITENLEQAINRLSCNSGE